MSEIERRPVVMSKMEKRPELMSERPVVIRNAKEKERMYVHLIMSEKANKVLVYQY